MEIQKTVARNIRRIREQKKITLETAAKLTGVSRSMLAQMEKGEVNPTISILWKIASGYKVSFSSLLDNGSSALLIRCGEMEPLLEDGGRYINRPAFPFQADRPFETYCIEIRPGGFLQAQAHLAGAEEYTAVFSGTVEIVADQETFRLNEGDSLRFQADVPHSYRNVGPQTVRLSMMIYYARP